MKYKRVLNQIDHLLSFGIINEDTDFLIRKLQMMVDRDIKLKQK